MNILLPIETINREIDFKIVLAGLLANNDNTIFIGQHDFLNTLGSYFNNGLYVGKNIFHKRSEIENGEIYKQLKEKNIDIIYLHEEGAVFKGQKDHWKKVLSNQYNLKFFDHNDAVCVWGNFQKDYDESRSANLDIFSTGHPRFDLYKKKWRKYFKSEIAELKKRYNNFVLINGNYSTYNHGLGLEYILSPKAGYVASDDKNRIEKIDFIEYSGSQCLSMIQLTHHLAKKFPEKNFIYRPHPSENQKFYETFFNGVKNIFVKHEGSVSAWIFASEAIIHDGCTTAIEASFADKPVINYKPISNEDNDIWFPNQLGIKCTSREEVYNIINNLQNFSFDIEKLESKELIKDLMSNYKKDSFDALTEVINNKLKDKNNHPTTFPNSAMIKKEYLKTQTKKKIYYLKNSKARSAYNYHSRKFYGFDKKYIHDKFKSLEEILGKQFKLKYHNPYLIEIK